MVVVLEWSGGEKRAGEGSEHVNKISIRTFFHLCIIIKSFNVFFVVYLLDERAKNICSKSSIRSSSAKKTGFMCVVNS